MCPPDNQCLFQSSGESVQCTGGIRKTTQTGTGVGLGVYPPTQPDSMEKNSFTSLSPYLWHKSLLPQREVGMS